MNVFEDLIGELKDENLLEDTVIELKRGVDVETGSILGPAEIDFELRGPVEFERDGPDARPDAFEAEEIADLQNVPDAPQIKTPADDREFFRKRAMEEVSSLQMVEHVLSGVEREHMKMSAAIYDDLAVKKALHKFLQVSGNLGSDEHAEAEYELLQETQSWHAALSVRDRNVSVANIRRFCEDSRPVLSSAALMALARFYRNSSFTEEVRGKFDFVVTRLFSRDAGLEKRKLLFSRLEMVDHVKTLYANWSSISYHSAQENKAEIELAVQRFEDLIKHFEEARSFDELLNADVFNTIRHFKEECGELFFVPDVTCAAVDCNVRLGNKYVDLIFKERAENGAATVEKKYGYTHDQMVSSAAAKTLLLMDLIKARPEEKIEPVVEKPAFEQESFNLPQTAAARNVPNAQRRSGLLGVSRWLVVTTVIATFLSGGLYLWADKFAGSTEATAVASEVNLEGTDLKAHIRTMRLSQETAYAVTQPSWDAMSETEQKEFLKKVFAFAESKGLKKVNLLNYKGRTVAFAAKGRFETLSPN